MGKILNQIFVIIISCSLFACSNDGCLENQSSIPLAGFYSSETGQVAAITNIDVTGIGAIGDSLLTDAATATKQVYLPFRSTSDNTAFCFHYKDFGDDASYNDTIWFEYESMPFFASEECGAMYRYKITSTRHTNILIDSVVVIDPDITNTDVERIKIYFTTE